MRSFIKRSSTKHLKQLQHTKTLVLMSLFYFMLKQTKLVLKICLDHQHKNTLHCHLKTLTEKMHLRHTFIGN